MRPKPAILLMLSLTLSLTCSAATITWLWDDFNGSYPGGFNGFIEEHFKVGDMFATHWYEGDSAHRLAPHTGTDRSQAFVYFKAAVDNAFVTYFETKSYTDPDYWIVDLVGLMAMRGQDPIDQTKPVIYRVRVYGHNDAYNPDDPAAYWRQMLEVQRPTVKKAEIYWTSSNNDTWQTLEVTQTGLDGGRYQWITFDSWYPGVDNGVDPLDYGYMIKDRSYMNWENLEIEYTPLAPAFSNMIVVADSTDSPGYFHVQNEARTFGLRCHYISGAITVPRRGDKVNLWGAYERLQPDKVYRATTVKILSSNNPLPRPVGMSVRCAGGQPDVAASQGPTNVGLLSSIWGRITYVGSGSFFVDDGSRMPYGSTAGVKGMKVYTGRTDLSVNQYILATGMIGLEYYSSSKMPVLQTRSASDILILQ